MPNPYPIALRERAVRAYENGTDTYKEVAAAQFSISVATLIRWVQRERETGSVAPLAKRGGWRSPVDVALLHRLVRERPDRTTDELTRAYTRRVGPAGRVHRSSILRALQRTGYVFKKTVAAGGTRSCDGPGCPSGVPTLGPPDRPAPSGLSRRIRGQSGDGPVARLVAPWDGAGRTPAPQLGGQT